MADVGSEGASCSVQNDRLEEDVALIPVEINGIFSQDEVVSSISRGEYKLVNLDSDSPLLQVGHRVFVCHWEQPLGCNMLVRGPLDDQGTCEVASVTDRRLVADQAILSNKAEPADENSADIEQTPAENGTSGGADIG